MNILITGITSFIGRALAKELIDEGYEVYGVVRPSSKNREGLNELTKLHVIECDMDDCGRLAEDELALPQMYACVHLAWEGAGRAGRMDRAVQQHNEDNTLKLLHAVKKLGCSRFIMAGSQAEYGVTLERVKSGEAADLPETESRRCDPISEYGKSKLNMLTKCGSFCEDNGITYIHCRIFSIYGVGDHPGTLISSITKACIADEEIALSSCEQKWNFLYITDCAKAIADLISCVFTTSEDGGLTEHVVNIASEDTRPLKDFVQAARDVIGKGSYTLGAPMGGPEGTPYLDPDTDRLYELTGFVPQVSFEEAVERIAASYGGKLNE